VHPATGIGVDRAVRDRRDPRAFSLVDVLVSIAVIGVLIALLLPTLSHVRESTRRVICQSNLRQIGIGIGQYADEWDDYLAPSDFFGPDQQPPPTNGIQLSRMMTLRINGEPGGGADGWDGLGLLYSTFQLSAPEIFYCPSHYGEHAFQRYALDWRVDEPELIGNYHYRGEGPNGAKRLRSVEPVRSALVTDGLRTTRDINHRVGMNVLRADLSVSWFGDNQGTIASMLAASGAGEPSANSVMASVWKRIDNPNLTPGTGTGGDPAH
jgi:type II secretory pathway pseudopilin PulG